MRKSGSGKALRMTHKGGILRKFSLRRESLEGFAPGLRLNEIQVGVAGAGRNWGARGAVSYVAVGLRVGMLTEIFRTYFLPSQEATCRQTANTREGHHDMN